MAVAFDAVGPSSAGASALSATSLTWSHINAGNCLVAAIAVGQPSPDTSHVTTATYNGVAMTSVAKVESGTVTAGYIQMFVLMNPSVGTFNVVVTDTVTAQILDGGSVSFTGVGSLGTPVTGHASASTSASVVVPTTTTTGMVVDAFCWGSGGTATATQTQRWMKVGNAGSAAGDGGQSTAASTGGNVTMGWSWAASDSWGQIAVELLPVSVTVQRLIRPSIARRRASSW